MTEPLDDTTLAVAETVSDALETPVDDLPPLAESIDIDALDEVVPSDSSQYVTVSFMYAGMQVFVHSGNVVVVQTVVDECD